MQKWMSWVGLLLALVLVVGCSTPAPAATAVAEPTATTVAERVAADTPAADAAASDEVALTLEGLDGTTHTLTMADLEAMPATKGGAAARVAPARSPRPTVYKGVLVTDLCALVGGLDPTPSLSGVAKDAYAMTSSYDQILNSDFITYDPGTGDEISVDGPLQVMVAYEQDGQPIPAEGDGPLRLAIISSTNEQVVDGHWLVKWVTQLRVKSMAEDWVLHLEGALTDECDRATFESCTATNCHGETWTDDEGQQWSGIPLYYLAGRVDDEIKHKGPAYNRELANAGYDVDIIATDGYSTTITSGEMYYNDNIMVANMVNGAPLPEEDFPLKLVGSDVSGKQSVGQIAQIVLHLPEAAATGEATVEATVEPTEEPTAAPTVAPTEAAADDAAATAATGETVLTISGTTETAFTQADLEALGVITMSAEHPKKGMQEYRGVPFKAVLEQAGVDAGASKLVVTASDGYTSELVAADVLACDDCLLAFGDDGSLNLVMPGMESSTWAKNVVQITVE
jgi:hypothetical protein